jgi:hypothetical protein
MNSLAFIGVARLHPLGVTNKYRMHFDGSRTSINRKKVSPDNGP